MAQPDREPRTCSPRNFVLSCSSRCNDQQKRGTESTEGVGSLALARSPCQGQREAAKTGDSEEGMEETGEGVREEEDRGEEKEVSQERRSIFPHRSCNPHSEILSMCRSRFLPLRERGWVRTPRWR